MDSVKCCKVWGPDDGSYQPQQELHSIMDSCQPGSSITPTSVRARAATPLVDRAGGWPTRGQETGTGGSRCVMAACRRTTCHLSCVRTARGELHVSTSAAGTRRQVKNLRVTSEKSPTNPPKVMIVSEEVPLDLKLRPTWEAGSPPRADSPYVRVCDSPGRSLTPTSSYSSPPSSPLSFASRPPLLSPFLFPGQMMMAPPPSPPDCKQATVHSRLAFSIENILKPSFGQTNTSSPTTEAVKTKSSRKLPKEEPSSSDDCPPGMVRGANGQLVPAWVFCTRYSDRPSSGPRAKKQKGVKSSPSDKRPRTAFSAQQMGRLKHEFDTNRYLTEERRRNLADELGLNENQIKIWFQNKRAKIKKANGQKGELAQMLTAQGLYNHHTMQED